MRGLIPAVVMMAVKTTAVAMVVGLWLPLATMLAPVVVAAAPGETIAAAARKVVKLYGAGGMRGLEAYQSGILVSPDGRIVTVMSTVLDADEITCVLDDGRRYPATLVGVDPHRELAVLSINGEDLPAFVLDEAEPVPLGTRILALSNLFGVAVGDERVSAQHGVIAGLVPLEARRGAYEAPYRGDVYILDCTTNNPGSAGGALVDWRGRLVGMLGKELRATSTGIWLNYALPVAEVAKGASEVVSGAVSQPASAVAVAFDPGALGAVFVPDVLDKTPPFVESTRAGSAAAKAGLVPDDLVVAVNGRAVSSRVAVREAIGRLGDGDPVRLTVIRGGAIVECDLGPKPLAAGSP